MSKRRKKKKPLIQTITAFMLVTTQVAALAWVSRSYCIAIYSTVVLEQPFPVETVSQQAIETILGVSFLKVLENIFEHNDGVIWGTSNSKSEEETEDETQEFEEESKDEAE